MSSVFVSSTCFDLMDRRAELEVHFEGPRVDAVMSDRVSSDFEVPGGVDSIETCLDNAARQKCSTTVEWRSRQRPARTVDPPERSRRTARGKASSTNTSTTIWNDRGMGANWRRPHRAIHPRVPCKPDRS